MSSPLRRPLSACTATAALVLVVAAPAVAESDTAVGTATSAAITLDLFDAVTLVGGSADALADTLGLAEASAVGLDLLEGTSVSASSDSTTPVAEPATGQSCATPVLPAPMDDLPVDPACARASAVGGDLPAAQGEGLVGDVSLEGDRLAALVSLLADGAAPEVAAAIDAAVEPLEGLGDELYGPVVDGLAAECQAGLDEVGGLATEVIDPVSDVLENDPTGFGSSDAVGPLVDAVDVLPPACQELLELTTSLPSIAAVVEDVAAALEDALAGLDLLTLELGSSTSDVATTTDTLTATADSTLVRLTLPALGDLTSTVEQLLTDVVDAALVELSESLAEEFRGLVPALTDVVDIPLGVLGVPDLIAGQDPLLVVEVLPASATATVDRVTGDVVTTGTAATATVQIAEALGALLGEDELSVEVPVGDSVTVLAGTPLESTVALGVVESVARDLLGRQLEGTAVTGASLDLVRGVAGGIGIELSQVEVLAGALAADSPLVGAPDPSDPGQLPNTGGGAVLAASLALVGGALLRRRR